MSKQINDKAGEDYFERINTQLKKNRSDFGLRRTEKRAMSNDNSRRYL